jgi:hypothetical protein
MALANISSLAAVAAIIAFVWTGCGEGEERGGEVERQITVTRQDAALCRDATIADVRALLKPDVKPTYENRKRLYVLQAVCGINAWD